MRGCDTTVLFETVCDVGIGGRFVAGRMLSGLSGVM